MITEDDEFERIEREIKWRQFDKYGHKLAAVVADADLTVVYSLRLTKAQRVKLLQLGGPQWIRNQIERSA
jgi:hypothetical protein